MKTIILPAINYIDFHVRSVTGMLNETYNPCPWMNIMLSGTLKYKLNNEYVYLKEGNVLYFRPGDLVGRDEQHTDVRYLSISFQMDNQPYQLDTQFPIIGERQYQLIYMLLRYYFGSGKHETPNHAASEQIFNLLLQEFESNCKKDTNLHRIKEIQEYVMNHYYAGIRSADVAKALSLNPSYCNTFYKKHTGETISTYINRVRLDHICSRLIYSIMPIRDIAAECGFQDIFYFSRWFHKHKGISPGQYRQQSYEALTSDKYIAKGRSL